MEPSKKLRTRGIIFFVIGVILLVIYFAAYNSLQLGAIVNVVLVGFGFVLTLGGIYYFVKSSKKSG